MKESLIKLVLIDRDGVINSAAPGGYVLSPHDFNFLPGSVDALRKLQNASLPWAVVTNPGGVGRGVMTAECLEAVHAHMLEELRAQGVQALKSSIFCCTDHPEKPFSRRKPSPLMLQEAMDFFRVTPQHTVMIGDDIRDMEAASRAGVASVLVLTGRGRQTQQDLRLSKFAPLLVCENLGAAVDFLLGHGPSCVRP